MSLSFEQSMLPYKLRELEESLTARNRLKSRVRYGLKIAYHYTTQVFVVICLTFVTWIWTAYVSTSYVAQYLDPNVVWTWLFYTPFHFLPFGGLYVFFSNVEERQQMMVELNESEVAYREELLRVQIEDENRHVRQGMLSLGTEIQGGELTVTASKGQISEV